MINWIKNCLSRNIEFEKNIIFKNIEVKGQLISYCQTERKVASLKNNVISTYVIIDYKQLEQLGLFESEKDFCLFQNEFFSELFFNNRNDLRWNIYFIIVSSSGIKYSETLTKIENNDDFMRKYFMNQEEFELFISNDYINKSEKVNSNNNVEILSQWELMLKQIGLDGCLYNKFSVESVNDYIEKDKKIQPIGRPSNNRKEIMVDEKLRVKRVDKLITNSYRKHCFDEHIELPLGNINLISGSNGSGKSSICEAIEYGLTGSIGGQYDLVGEVSLECINMENDIIKLSSKKSLDEMRAVDMAWYGTTSIGRKITLNNNFSVFNYLNANASTKYAQNAENGVDINELLKNLIFGEEVTEANLKVHRYYEEFNKEFKYRNKIITELDNEIEQLNKKFKDSESTINIWNQINVALQRCFIKNEIDYNNLDDKGKLKFFNNIFDLSAKSVKFIKENLFNIKSDTIDDLLVMKRNLDEKFYYYNMHKKEIANATKIIDEKNYYYNSLVEILIKLDYTEENEILHKIVKQFNTDDVILKFSKLKSQYQNKKMIKDSLLDICNRYDEVFINNYRDEVIDDIFIIEEEKKLNIDKSNLIDMELVIKDKIEHLNNVSNLNVQLIDIGKSIINIRKNDGYCPLCGHNYMHRDDLLSAIKKSEELYGNVQGEVNLLIDKKNVLKTKIENSQITIEKFKYIRELNFKKVSFINELKNFMDIDYSINIEKIKDLLNNEIAKLNEYLIKEEENYKFITNFESTLIYLQFKRDSNSNDFIGYCKDRIDIIKKKRCEIEKEMVDLKTEIVELEAKINKNNEELSDIQNPIDELNLSNEIIQNIELISNMFNIGKNNLYDWCQQYEICSNMLMELYEIDKDNLFNDTNQLKIRELLEKLNSFKSKRNRCNIAINTFKKLKPLEEYMEEFIVQNAGHIEKIFKMIHKPKEFSDLRIQNGKISFTRTKTGEITDMTKISTGQSISLTFSILLSLYMSAPNAPRIIILDEPVANMDDMHILNLIDLVRELVLNGNQIFITTANDQIAKFLRRKFSFMEESFKHIMLNRVNDKQTQIVEVIYSPNHDGYKDELKIS